jgi:hypothetical protein
MMEFLEKLAYIFITSLVIAAIIIGILFFIVHYPILTSVLFIIVAWILISDV